MAIKSMNDFFVTELQRLFGEGKRLVRLVPDLEKSAASKELKTMLSEYARQAKFQIKRLEEVFTDLGKNPKAANCPRVEGLCTECEKIAALDSDPHIRDVAIIATSQHLMHDQIAGYGCVRTWAKILGQPNAATLLQTTLDEMKQFDKRFTTLSEKVNKEAMTLVA